MVYFGGNKGLQAVVGLIVACCFVLVGSGARSRPKQIIWLKDEGHRVQVRQQTGDSERRSGKVLDKPVLDPICCCNMQQATYHEFLVCHVGTTPPARTLPGYLSYTIRKVALQADNIKDTAGRKS